MKRIDVENALLKTGVPSGVLGFKYITDAVMLLNQDEWKSPKFTALYCSVARMNNTTGQRVERAIRHAFEAARKRSDSVEAVKHYIGLINCTNSASLTMLYKRVKDEENGNIYIGNMSEDAVREIVRDELRKIMGGIE